MNTTPVSSIRHIRKARGMTAEELAFRAKLASATVYRAERGIGRPTDDTLEAIARVLEVGVADLRDSASTPDDEVVATNGKHHPKVPAS